MHKLTWPISGEDGMIKLEYTTIFDCLVGLILHCDVSTLPQILLPVQFLVAYGPNPNDGLMSEQKTSAKELTLVIGHNTP